MPQLAPDAGDPEAMAEHERVGHNVLLDVRYVPPASSRPPGQSGPEVAEAQRRRGRTPGSPEQSRPDVAEAQRRSRMWVRPRGALPDDLVTRACVLAYLSDMGWAFDSVDDGGRVGGPSLDHAVWLQRPVDVADWMFLDLKPVSVAGARWRLHRHDPRPRRHARRLPHAGGVAAPGVKSRRRSMHSAVSAGIDTSMSCGAASPIALSMRLCSSAEAAASL